MCRMAGMVTPAHNVIRKLGGAQAVAKLLDLDVSNVHRWTYPKARGGTGGKVPTRHQDTLLRKAEGKLTYADFFEKADA